MRQKQNDETKPMVIWIRFVGRPVLKGCRWPLQNLRNKANVNLGKNCGSCRVAVPLHSPGKMTQTKPILPEWQPDWLVSIVKRERTKLILPEWHSVESGKRSRSIKQSHEHRDGPVKVWCPQSTKPTKGSISPGDRTSSDVGCADTWSPISSVRPLSLPAHWRRRTPSVCPRPPGSARLFLSNLDGRESGMPSPGGTGSSSGPEGRSHDGRAADPRHRDRKLVVPRLVREIHRRRRRRIPSCSARPIARRPSATPCAWRSTTSSAPGSTGSPTARCSGSISTWGSTNTSTASSRSPGPATGALRPTISATGIAASPRSRRPTGWASSTEYRRLREFTDAPIKMPVPGPFTLAGCIDGGDVYADRNAVTEALIPIVNAELKALVAAGVDFIQLDEPSFACHPDEPELFPRRDRPHRRGRERLHQHAHVLRQLPGPGRGPAVVSAALPAHRPGEGEPARPRVRQPRDGRDRAARRASRDDGRGRRAWSTSRTPGSSRPSWWPSGCGRC